MGFGIHSPYLFYIAREVFPDTSSYYAFASIERLRRKLLSSKEKVVVKDYGTGKGGPLPLPYVTRTSPKSAREAQLLMRMAVLLHAQEIVELGTSVGLTTAYLASASSNAHVTTFEGAPELAKIAEGNWAKLGLKNIRCICGPLDDTLYNNYAPTREVDLAFLDANHRGEPTLRYFKHLLRYAGEKSIFVVDDIHQSPDMLAAWRTICAMPEVTATFDLFSMGMVFFDKNLEKKTYKIRT